MLRAAIPVRRVFDPDSPLAVFAWYLVATLVMTWPLAAGLTTDLPADLGDPVLNLWILGWNVDHLSRFVSGDLGAFSGYWNANIFYPAPLALAYSEHLFAQSLQALPVWMLTGNLLLCYNLLFLSTFALSALGAYLLARDHVGSGRAAVVAGLLYGFALYRVPQFPHLQVLSSQWMPFALLGFGRYARTGRLLPLAGGVAALVAQNLSNGYYMVYFAPFLAAYVLWELKRAGRLVDWRRWVPLLASAAVVLSACWPFIHPYLELRQAGFGARRLPEVQSFSADLLAPLTAGVNLTVWGHGRMSAHPVPEGELFPGIVPVLLVAAALVAAGLNRSAWRGAAAAAGPTPAWVRWSIRLCAAVAVLYGIVAIVMLVRGTFVIDWGPLSIRAIRLPRITRVALAAVTVAALLSPRLRAWWRRRPPSSIWFFAAAAFTALVLALGPAVRVAGTPIVAGPYRLLYDWVPGFDGLRVPSRMAMLALLFGSVVAACGAEVIARRWRRGVAIVAGLSVLFLVEATAAPILINADPGVVKTAAAPLRIQPGRFAPQVYRYVVTLPHDAVIVEFPFGEDAWEVQYMFYSTVHWRRMLNGYSGGFPEVNLWHRRMLGDPTTTPELAWKTLGESGATHAIVHEAAFRTPDEVRNLESWLTDRGAAPVATFGGDAVFVLPLAPRRPAGTSPQPR